MGILRIAGRLPAAAACALLACSGTPPAENGNGPAGNGGSEGPCAPGEGLVPGRHTFTLDHGGRARTYHLTVPAGADGPRPLVMSFHGGMGTADGHAAMTGLPAAAEAEGFLLAEPEGTGQLQTWNAGNCCGYAARNDVDDVAFARVLVDHVAERVCVDRDRIHATGFSNGGMLSHRLACEASDLVASVAPVGGGIGHLDMDADPPAEIYACVPERPVPVLHVHGLEDGCYRFEGGVGEGVSGIHFVGIPETIAGWVTRHGCDTEPETVLEVDGARCVRHGGCADGAVVELCTDDDAGHVWPSGPIQRTAACGGATTDRLDANALLTAFFAAHPMR